MTQFEGDTNWIGTVPEPPADSKRHEVVACTLRPDCPAGFHSPACKRNIRQVEGLLDRRRCAREGHDMTEHWDGTGTLLFLQCSRCQRSWKCTEA